MAREGLEGTYRNITVWLGPIGAEGTFSVRPETVPGVGVPPATPSSARLPRDWSRWTDRLAAGRLDLREIGRFSSELAEVLLAGPAGQFVERAYERLRGQGRLVRLRLVCGDPVLAAVPWELARSSALDGKALWENPALSVVRLEPGQRAAEAVPLSGRLGVTVIEQPVVGGGYPELPRLLNLSRGEGPVQTPPSSEMRTTPEPLRLGDDIEVCNEASAAGVTAEMARGNGQVLVLFGHGDRIGDEVHLLARGWQGAEPVTPDALAGAAVRGRPTVAMIVACRSGQRMSAPEEPEDPGRWAGPAMALVRAGVPYVIAVQHEVRFDAAQAFVITVLTELAAGASVDGAVAAGRHAMRAAVPDRRWPQAWLPVLYAFDIDGVARPFTVTQHVEAARIDTVVAAEGAPPPGSDAEIRSHVVAEDVGTVVGWRPGAS